MDKMKEGGVEPGGRKEVLRKDGEERMEEGKSLCQGRTAAHSRSTTVVSTHWNIQSRPTHTDRHIAHMHTYAHTRELMHTFTVS